MDRISKLRFWRRVSQAAFIVFFLSLPVFDLLRYDVAAREFYLFGQAWTLGIREGIESQTGLGTSTHVAVRFFLKAVLPWIIALAIFPLLGVLFGRLFCGWMCPEGTLFELAEHLTLKLLGRRNLWVRRPNDPDNARGNPLVYGALSAFMLLVIPPVTGAFLSGFFIAPARIWREIATWDISFGLGAGIIGVSIYMVVTSVLVRHVFCRYVCAAGLMQMLLGWVSPVSLRVRFDRARAGQCTDCRKCETVCFMNVKPRLPKRDINCVNCGECITACRKELGANRGLFDYGFGARRDSSNEGRSGELPAPCQQSDPRGGCSPLKSGNQAT